MMESRREMQELRKHLNWYHRMIGEVVLWAAFNPLTDVMDDVYNEPGERGYLPAVRVQTLWINLTEAGKRIDDERYDMKNNISLAISIEAFRNAGVPNVFRDDMRVFDIFKYWHRYWSVDDYEILGRFPQGDSTTVGIQAVEIDFRSDYPFEPSTPIEGLPASSSG